MRQSGTNEPARTLTIAEAAELTGATPKAIRNRVDRGQLRVVKRNNVRRIPLAELERAGLLEGAEQELAGGAAPAGSDEVRELVNLELLRELAQAHETIGELRALEVKAGGDREELEAELEARRRHESELAVELERTSSELELLRRRGLLARLRNR